jgi:hypothetical protein
MALFTNKASVGGHAMSLATEFYEELTMRTLTQVFQFMC